MTNVRHPKRFITFDLVRGIAIIGVIVFHRMLWDFYAPTRLASGNFEISLAEGFLIFFFSMAGVFYVISGCVTAYVTYHRLSSGRNKPKHIIYGGWVTGLSLIGFHYIFRLFFVRATDTDTAIITYFIFSGTYQGISPLTVFNVGTLQMIGITSIFVSTLLGIIFRNEGLKQIKRAYSIFLIIGVIVLVLTPYLQTLLFPSLVEAIAVDNWGYFFFVSPIVYGLFPMFPFLSFGCFGAMLGIALGREEDPKTIKIALILVSLLFWAISIPFFKGVMVTADYRDWGSLINQLARQVIQRRKTKTINKVNRLD